MSNFLLPGRAKCFNIFPIIIGLTISASGNAVAKTAISVSDEHIRSLVAEILREKDQQIEKLEARIQQLERARSNTSLPPGSDNKLSKIAAPIPPVAPTQAASTNPPPADTIKAHEVRGSILSKLGDLGEELEELKEAASEKGLDITGFFDINAKTDNATEQTFSVGSIELDLEYRHNENFAASSALVLCGNSSGADFAAPPAITCGTSGPGGIGAGGAGFAVAIVDYHKFDHSIPPRGRIFNNQGFHIQAGRFDLPFSSDYQNYANKDRVTISAPITTARMQLGGFNGDGIRSYGSWGAFNYSAFWTDAMFANDGSSVGGRLGASFGQNIYRTHGSNGEGVEFGISHLTDLDKDRHIRHSVYGADLSFGYAFLKVQNEFMLTQSHNNLIGEDDTDYGKAHELGYHTTLIADLESFINYPVSFFTRYGRWQPKQRIGLDYDGKLIAIDNISLLTVGFNYRLSEYFRFKLEYTDSLGTSTQERYFDKKLGIAQMVVSF